MNPLAILGELPKITHAWETGEKLYNDGLLKEADWVAFKDAVWALIKDIADGQFEKVVKQPDTPDVNNPSDPIPVYTPSPGEHGQQQPLPNRDDSGMTASDLNKAEWALVAKYAPWDLQSQ